MANSDRVLEINANAILSERSDFAIFFEYLENPPEIFFILVLVLREISNCVIFNHKMSKRILSTFESNGFLFLKVLDILKNISLIPVWNTLLVLAHGHATHSLQNRKYRPNNKSFNFERLSPAYKPTFLKNHSFFALLNSIVFRCLKGQNTVKLFVNYRSLNAKIGEHYFFYKVLYLQRNRCFEWCFGWTPVFTTYLCTLNASKVIRKNVASKHLGATE
jgi:hypothetical protein